MASKAIGFLNFKFGADLGGFDRAMKKAQKNLKRFGKNIQKTGRTLTTSLTLPILAFGAASIKAFDEQEKAIGQVEAGLKSTGMAAGFTSEQLQKMAAELQKVSLFGDEDILKNATAQLLTFTNITGEQFAKTQEIALDLATRLDGDLKSASIMLGKALNDPVANLSALSRAGIQFSEDQKTLIKSLVETGKLAEAQTIILEELERQYGGSAEAARDAGLGGVEALKNKFMDLTEQIGQRLLPIVTKLASFLVGLLEKFDKLDEGTKDTIVTFGLVLAAIGPILIFVGRLSVGLAAASKAFVALNLVMKANPLLRIASIILTVVSALIYFYNTNLKVRASIKGLFAAAKIYFKGIAEFALKTFAGIGELIIGVFTLDIDRIKNGFNKSKDAIVNYGTDIGSAFTDAFNEEMTKDLGANVQEISMDFNKISINNPFKEVSEDTNKAIESTTEYKKSLDPLLKNIEKFKEQGLMFGPQNDESYQRMITMQDVYNDSVSNFGSIFANSMETAMTSQENFFSAFIKNLKQAIAKQLAMLAALEITGLLLGGIGGGKLASTLPSGAGNLLKGIIPFSQGGLVTGPTTALIGEGIGTTASNPEVVAPLDRLKQFMGGGTQNVVVEGVIKGNDIFLSNRNTGYNRQRSV